MTARRHQENSSYYRRRAQMDTSFRRASDLVIHYVEIVKVPGEEMFRRFYSLDRADAMICWLPDKMGKLPVAGEYVMLMDTTLASASAAHVIDAPAARYFVDEVLAIKPSKSLYVMNKLRLLRS
jgi:hypothetical protein